MAREWTPSQRLAMDTRDKTLLVSAAAGSGKTATLTERIIRSILDKDNPISISEMLIVTFTKAATAELSERIGDAIRRALHDNPGNERLEEELHLLPSAHISTIDAFCGDILRANCERAGVNPGYRILDEAEATLLADGILDGMFDEIYEGNLAAVATPEELSLLAECLTDTKHQGDLAAEIRRIHHKTKDLLDGVARIRTLVSEYDPESFTTVEATRLGAHAIVVAHEYADHFLTLAKEHRAANIDYGDPKAKCEERIEVLAGDEKLLSSILASESYNEIRDIFINREIVKSSKISIPSAHKEFLPDTTAMRKAMREGFASVGALFKFSESAWRESFRGLYSTLSILVRVIEEFDRAFTAEKIRLGACEFSDVSRYTYNCLWQNGERTDVALAEAMKYRAIYVDEYQDVNAIQHKIFEAISQPTNRFMVGDIKQSIYGFRGADSTIFARLKTTYPEISEAGDSPVATLFMSENFRCDEGIIDFSNGIFDKLFTIMRESIGYMPSDNLKHGKKYDGAPPERRYPVVSLLPRGSNKKGVIVDEDECKAEPLVIAEKIAELLQHGKKNDGEPILPGDIAIIMRSTGGRDGDYARALAAHGIPSAVSDTTAFFLNPEILLIMSILNSIDNPHRDIYLAATMMSPVFSFTADEVTSISYKKTGSLYSALKLYNEEHPDFEKGRRFVSWLSRCRTFSEGSTVDVLINRIYRETGILTFASGVEGRECLNRFYEHARQFEASSFKGLYNFINYINGVIDRKHSFDVKEANLDPNAVKIITAHSSKGLEFPVVIFAYPSYSFNRAEGGKLVYDSDFGISVKLRSKSGLTLLENPTIPLIKDMCRRRSIEEEARVLYVALTRARERLYVIGTANKKLEEIYKDIEAAREHLTPYTVYGMSNYIEMITSSLGTLPIEASELLPEMSDELRELIYPTVTDEACEGEETSENTPKTDPVSSFEGEFDLNPDFNLPEGELSWLEMELGDSPDTDRIYKRLSYVYPDGHLTKIPEKLSVSRLYPDILDDKEGEASLDEIIERQSHLNMERLPAFATGKDLTESAKRGIATHLLFQFCDFENLKNNGAEAELGRLVGARFISEADALRVRVDEVEKFRHSRLIDEILAARKLYRELRFNVRLPASLFTLDDTLKARLDGEGTEVLVQGVIDCLYEDEDGGLHLVDYKTDRMLYAEIRDPELAAEKLRKIHSEQLHYYAMAIERMLVRLPDTVEVYALQLGRCVEV